MVMEHPWVVRSQVHMQSISITLQLHGWLKTTSWLVHVLLQKWISGKSSPAPAPSNSHWWYCALVVLEMAHQGTILQLVEAHWGALDGLSCFTVVASTRKVQTLPTNLNTITAPNTHLQTAYWFAETINGKLLAPPGICQLYLFQDNRCLKRTGNRQYPTAFTVYPDLKFIVYMTA